MATIESENSRPPHIKKWGWEEWIVNNEMYCGKRLHFTEVNCGTSMHFHMKKHETMYIESGHFLITVIDKFSAEEQHHYLLPGDSIVITPGTVHRITCTSLPETECIDPKDAILVEFSTHHEDSDSYRVKL